MLSTFFLRLFCLLSKLSSFGAFMSGMKANSSPPCSDTGPEQNLEAAPPSEDKRSAIVAGLQGIPWQDGIYLVPTSEIDGRRRWETIILLLAEKISDRQVKQALLAIHSAQAKE